MIILRWVKKFSREYHVVYNGKTKHPSWQLLSQLSAVWHASEAKGSNLHCIYPFISFVCLSKQSNISLPIWGRHADAGGNRAQRTRSQPISMLNLYIHIIINAAIQHGNCKMVCMGTAYIVSYMQNISDYFNFGQKKCRKIKRLNVRDIYSKVYNQLSLNGHLFKTDTSIRRTPTIRRTTDTLQWSKDTCEVLNVGRKLRFREEKFLNDPNYVTLFNTRNLIDSSYLVDEIHTVQVKITDHKFLFFLSAYPPKPWLLEAMNLAWFHQLFFLEKIIYF